MLNYATARVVGTDEAGYSVSIDVPTRTMRVDAWGFWPVDVCSTFAKSLIDGCRNAGVRRLELETSRLKPLREEGENAWLLVMGALPGIGLEAIAVRSNSLTKLQLLRIVRASPSKDLVQFP
jgi:hypothetical protein